MDQDEYVTVEELAEQLKVNARTIQRLVERKQLMAVRIGKQLRFRRDWVDEWLRKNMINQGDRTA